MASVVLLIGILLFLGGCTHTVIPPSETEQSSYVLQDLRTYPQNAYHYSQNIRSKVERLEVQQHFERYWFAPWHYEKAPETLDAVLWPFRAYRQGVSYGENLKPIASEWFDTMYEQGNFQTYDTLKYDAIALRYLHLRNFPTHKPLFRDPSRAGEGFPFDYVQNSGVHANEPLYISHYSKDRSWVYVFSAYATGWVPSSAIALMHDDAMKQWMEAQQVFILKEHLPIEGEGGQFIFDGRIGMMLPLVRLDETHVTVLTAVRGSGHWAKYVTAIVPRNTIGLAPISLDDDRLPLMANRMLESHYGWGGMYEERDCSSTLRDFFAPFGIWLPRNSAQQARMGKVIRFDDMDESQKLDLIKVEGIPFETLLYRKGHVLLYLGLHDGQVMVLHNLWGVKTKRGNHAGRKIVGKAVISTLELGKELPDYDPEGSLLKHLESMNIITQSKPKR